VQNALSVGFTLHELSRLLKIREKGGAPCEEVRALAAMKLRDIEEKLRGLSALRDGLRKMLEQWDTRLAHTRKGHQARLLDMIAALPASSRSSPRGAGLDVQRRRTLRGTNAHTRSRRVEQ
jgi:DNA-binding transcriptional MerR regulator